MLCQNIRILDFDASVIKQQNLLSRYAHQVINLKDLAPSSRLWMNSCTNRVIQEYLKETSRNAATFLGSGDFHHLSSLLLSQFQEPLSLIVFDFHPDWDILPPRLACGSWVSQCLRKDNILKCFLIGVSSEDISFPWIQGGNLNSLKNNRLEIYPYAHPPTPVFLRKVPENVSVRAEKIFLGSRIYWDELNGKDLKEFSLSLIRRLPTRNVYVSIDKDCLKNEYALTNWEEGKLSLEELLLMLRLIKENLEIVGLDITGDYSRVSVAGRLKGILSRLDHPKEIAAEKIPEETVTAINETTNLKILDTLLS